jgi:hypothetical protein
MSDRFTASPTHRFTDPGVGEHCSDLGRRTVRSAGGAARDNADMSNDKTGENPVRRKPKVSWVKVVFPGLVGP